MRPDELEKALSEAGMAITDRTGVIYNPLADRWQRSKDMDVNYMVLAEKRARRLGSGQPLQEGARLISGTSASTGDKSSRALSRIGA